MAQLSAGARANYRTDVMWRRATNANDAVKQWHCGVLCRQQEAKAVKPVSLN